MKVRDVGGVSSKGGGTSAVPVVQRRILRTSARQQPRRSVGAVAIRGSYRRKPLRENELEVIQVVRRSRADGGCESAPMSRSRDGNFPEEAWVIAVVTF